MRVCAACDCSPVADSLVCGLSAVEAVDADPVSWPDAPVGFAVAVSASLAAAPPPEPPPADRLASGTSSTGTGFDIAA